MINRFNYFPVFNFVLILIIASLSYLLTLLPLTNTLGYEFSVIIGIALSVAGGFSIINFKKKIGNKNRQYWFYLLAVFLPIFISYIFTSHSNSCPILNGLQYYVIFALPPFIIGILLGKISFALSKKFSFIIFPVIWIILILLPLYEIYFYPQIYFFNPIIGFYPGVIYDESIPLSSKIISYKIITLFFFYYSSVFISRTKLKSKIRFLLVSIIFIGFFFAKPYIGFATNNYVLEKVLPITIKTEHFKIHLPHYYSQEQIKLTAKLHEFYYEEISERLKIIPSKQIETFVFKNAEQKREYFGAGAADVTKIWQYKIFTNDIYKTLKHELVHVFSAEIGQTPFKVAGDFNPAMIEGFATAVENNIGIHSVHYMAALALNSGFNANLQTLFKGFNFFGSNSSVGYIYSGSFIKFLMDRYGINEVKKLYGDIDFKRYFGKSLKSLSAEHEEFLRSLKFELNPHSAALRFGYKPLIQKACPRFIANKLDLGWELYREMKYSAAKKEFVKILDVAENYSALSGYAYSARETGDYLTALQTLLKYNSTFKNSSYYYAYELLLGDVLTLNNEFYESVELYDSLAKQNPSPYYYSLAKVRLTLLDLNRLNEYLSGSNFDKFSILQEIYKNGLNAFSIPVLINLSESLQQNYSSFIQFIDGRKIIDDNLSAYSYYSLALYSLSNIDFERAENFILIALKKSNDGDFRKNMENELIKIKWLRKNFEE